MYRNSDGYYVSDNRKIAVNGQFLFADDAVVQQANQTLDALGSLVRLKRVPTRLGWIKFDDQGSGAQWSCYLPWWQPETHISSYHTQLNDPNSNVVSTNKPGDSYITWSDCHRNTQTVMGARSDDSDARSESQETERPIVKDADANNYSGEDVLPPVRSPLVTAAFLELGKKPYLANRAKYAFLQYCSQNSDRSLAPRVSGKQIREAWKWYKDKMASDPPDWPLEWRINEFIVPKVGEGLCIMPAEAAPGFESRFAWEDLKKRLGADLWRELHIRYGAGKLSPETPCSYMDFSAMLDRLAENKSPDATEDHIKDALVCTYMEEKLARLKPSFAREDEYRNALAGSNLRGVVERLLQREEDLVFFVREGIINMEYTGKQRDQFCPKEFPQIVVWPTGNPVAFKDKAYWEGEATGQKVKLEKPTPPYTDPPPADAQQQESYWVNKLRQIEEAKRLESQQAAEESKSRAEAARLEKEAEQRDRPQDEAKLRMNLPPTSTSQPGPANLMLGAPKTKGFRITGSRAPAKKWGGPAVQVETVPFRERVLHGVEEWLREIRRHATATWKSVWNFHWAGIVMTDGHDYVTLENLSVEAEDYPNRLWYFEMYRRLDSAAEFNDRALRRQTFHQRIVLTGGVGDLALTLKYRYFPPPRLTMLRSEDRSESHATLQLSQPPPPMDPPGEKK